MHAHIADMCRRFAKAGYYAIAPELYFRQGDPKAYPEVPKLISEVVAKVPDAQVMDDLDSCVAFAKGEGKADTAKLGITGFCWGGRIVWLYAAHNPALKAGVAWYGPLNRGYHPATTANPIDVVGKLNGPVLGLYGGADSGIPKRLGRQDACRSQGGQCRCKEVGDRDLSRHAARLQRRLSSELSQGSGRGRLEAGARLVQGQRRDLTDR